jgi:hypothetical protein
MHRFIAPLVVTVACLAAPAVASADSGTITNVTDAGGGWIQATYTINGTCAGASGSTCSWWTHAVQVPADGPCRPWAEGENTLTYSGAPDDGFQGPATDVGSDYFRPNWNPVRLCLYIRYAADGDVIAEVLVAETVLSAPGTPPAAGTLTPEVPPMTVARAKASLSSVLKSKYGRRFNGKTLRRSCSGPTAGKVRCRVSWRKRRLRYHGSVTFWNDPADPANRIVCRLRIAHDHSSR